MNNDINLLGAAEQQLRLDRLKLTEPSLVSDNASLFYLTGRVFAGYVWLEPGNAPRYFVKRPTTLKGDGITLIRKPEQIIEHLATAPAAVALELGSLTYNDAERLRAALGNPAVSDLSAALMQARSVKTHAEIELMRRDGQKQAEVYHRIPHLYREGMRDIELQAAIEYQSRLEGSLGLFRVAGNSMEIHMGSVLTGENADTPSPYDFAMGGAGLDPSLPVGASGEEILPGRTVMVDMNGNFNGYMTDMTRTFSHGDVPERARAAHQCSIDICRRLAAIGKPGVAAKELYEEALHMAAERGLESCFMGHAQKAGFVGHGVGIQVNELPVLAPRGKAVLAAGNTIAIEPKFVLPGYGAVGIENTYVVTEQGLECITPAPEDIISLV